jgi:hypothetical protein
MEKPQRERRRYPQTIGGSVYLAVLATAAVGLGIVVAVSWRGGLFVISAALVLAAVARALIPDAMSGMLKVRARWIDVLTYGVLGAGLFAVVFSVSGGPH